MALNLRPYLNFNGNAREAMEFYHSIFGGKLDINTFGDIMPGENAEFNNKIMHSELVSDAITFYGADGPMGEKINFEGNITMCLMGDEKEKIIEFFNKLSAGGKVGTPVAPQSWGDEYGDLEDKFGVRWMVNIYKPS